MEAGRRSFFAGRRGVSPKKRLEGLTEMKFQVQEKAGFADIIAG